ncbi:hypothetical protein [Clostridium sporogenes]|uniref:hypothetical protein n=1 Tax=Clostridium sporogenes TaxID=1509 RepID=UPI0022378B70|nr:hypothetical protein [Clostridium sporogenes]MCW6079688.1 hypothetical protein [Clostridium sporogenes]MDU1422637.1 hypothetical protein [Clostridium botulinum]
MKSIANGQLLTIILVILVIMAIVFIIIIYNRIAKSRYFICPSCGNRFKASAKQLMVALHSLDEHCLKCPKCGKKDYMKEMKGK